MTYNEKVAGRLVTLAKELITSNWEKVGPSKEKGKFVWKDKNTGETRVQIGEPSTKSKKKSPKKKEEEPAKEQKPSGGPKVNYDKGSFADKAYEWKFPSELEDHVRENLAGVKTIREAQQALHEFHRKMVEEFQELKPEVQKLTGVSNPSERDFQAVIEKGGSKGKKVEELLHTVLAMNESLRNIEKLRGDRERIQKLLPKSQGEAVKEVKQKLEQKKQQSAKKALGKYDELGKRLMKEMEKSPKTTWDEYAKVAERHFGDKSKEELIEMHDEAQRQMSQSVNAVSKMADKYSVKGTLNTPIGNALEDHLKKSEDDGAKKDLKTLNNLNQQIDHSAVVQYLVSVTKYERSKNKREKPDEAHSKVKPATASLDKVKNILSKNDVLEDSDEIQELAGFKKTLGQRVPESKKGQYYVRNVAKLKADFLQNMDPSNYSNSAAFKKAVERIRNMPITDFGKVLASIMSEDEDEEGAKSASVKVAALLLKYAKELVADWEKVGPAKEKGKFVWKDKDTGETRIQISAPSTQSTKKPSEKKEKPSKEQGPSGGDESISVGGKKVSWGDVAARRSDLYNGAAEEMKDAFGDIIGKNVPDDAKEAWKEYGQLLDKIKALRKRVPDSDERFRALAGNLNNSLSKMRSIIKKHKLEEGAVEEVKQKLQEKKKQQPASKMYSGIYKDVADMAAQKMMNPKDFVGIGEKYLKDKSDKDLENLRAEAKGESMKGFKKTQEIGAKHGLAESAIGVVFDDDLAKLKKTLAKSEKPEDKKDLDELNKAATQKDQADAVGYVAFRTFEHRKEKAGTQPDVKEPISAHKPSGYKKTSLNKVKNVLDSNAMQGSDAEDSLEELAGFKKTLGKRVPEGDEGKYYVRNVAKLKADFIKNMSPSNYSSPEAFQTAKSRMQSMAAGDFAKVLAAITADDEGEEGKSASVKVAETLLSLAKEIAGK